MSDIDELGVGGEGKGSVEVAVNEGIVVNEGDGSRYFKRTGEGAVGESGMTDCVELIWKRESGEVGSACTGTCSDMDYGFFTVCSVVI